MPEESTVKERLVYVASLRQTEQERLEGEQGRHQLFRKFWKNWVADLHWCSSWKATHLFIMIVQ